MMTMNDFEQLIDKISTLLDSDDEQKWTDALSLLSNLEKRTLGKSEKIEIFNNKGYYYYLSQNYRKAKDYFQKTRRIDTDNAFSLHYLAHCYEDEGKYDKALEKFNEYISEIDADDPHILAHIGSMHIENKDYDDAKKSLEKSLSIDETEDGLFYYIRYLITQKEFDSALKYSKSFLKSFPYDEDVQYWLGLCYQMRGNYDLAQKEFDIGYGKSSDSQQRSFFNSAIARLKFDQKDLESSEKYYEKALSDDDENQSVSVGFGYLDWILGKNNSALEYFQNLQYVTPKLRNKEIPKSHDSEHSENEIIREIKKKKNDETKRIEFKSSFLSLSEPLNDNENESDVKNKMQYKIAQTINAFANNDGGSIIIGVTNSKKIVGLDNDYLFIKQSFEKNNKKTKNKSRRKQFSSEISWDEWKSRFADKVETYFESTEKDHFTVKHLVVKDELKKNHDVAWISVPKGPFFMKDGKMFNRKDKGMTKEFTAKGAFQMGLTSKNK